MFVNDEFNIQRVRLLCTVIKFHVVEETKEAKEAVLYFARDLEVNFDRGWQLYCRILV